jgi:hypothetical protein
MVILAYAVNSSLRLIKYYTIKTYGKVEVQLQAFLNSARDGGETSAARLGCLVPSGKNFRYHAVGGKVSSGATLD